MHGTQQIRFSDLFRDTLNAFGEEFARYHYIRKHKMAEWEFAFWMKIAQR